MSTKRNSWSETAPLLGQQQRFQSLPARLPSSNIGMASPADSVLPLRPVFLGVDVGTGSARAGIFDQTGKLLGSSSSPIQIWKEGNCIEQSSTDIWHAVCAAVKSACSKANVSGEEVKGLGFAATCSLVAVDADGSPVTVSWSGDSRRNVIVWMDHRAVEQAERINSFNSPVLQYCGGSLSPEMQPPKLLWVKENLPDTWSMVFRWMDLSDWLSYRATGDDTRSLCTTVCKWTYLGHAHMSQYNEKDSRNMEACGWDDDFWEEIGLRDLVDGHHAKIGRSVAFPGHPLGSGLTPVAAKELGLVAGIPVGVSLIDAHAGGVGVLESVPGQDSDSEGFDKEMILHRMALVCGTSTCHMAVSRDKLFIPGVWGPFWSDVGVCVFGWAVEQEDKSLLTKWMPLSEKYVEEWVGPGSPRVRSPSSMALESIPEMNENNSGICLRDSKENLTGSIPENKPLHSQSENDLANCNHKNLLKTQQEYFVPWHLPYHRAEVSGTSASALASGLAKKDDKKAAVVYSRYYHIFSEGELEGLISGMDNAVVVDRFYDKSNWCIVLEKIV